MADPDQEYLKTPKEGVPIAEKAWCDLAACCTESLEHVSGVEEGMLGSKTTSLGCSTRVFRVQGAMKKMIWFLKFLLQS